jgi:PAS domain S-box-containing protein
VTDFTTSAEELYRLIIEEASDFAMFVLDPEGRIETWSPGAVRIFGYEPADIVGRHFSVLFTARDREAGIPEKELSTARRGGRAEDSRWHVRKDGQRFFADGVTTALSGKGFAKIARDVTERFLTEQRLAAQLALTTLLHEEHPLETIAKRVMQTVCENLGWDVGILWEASDGKLRCINQWHAAEITEDAAASLCEAEFMSGQGLPGAVWKDGHAVWIPTFKDAQRFPRAAQAQLAGLETAFAFPIVHLGQLIGVMEFFSREQREPDQPLMPVMTLIGAQVGDYIQRRRTAQALRESEERYRLVADTAQDAIFTIDESSTILFCNPAVKRLFGYAPEELIGRTLDTIIPHRLRQRHHEGIQRYLRTGRRNIPWGGVELPGLHRDGHEFPAEISFGEWTDGKRTVFTGFARDITERKRTLEQVEAARAQLERRAEEEAAFRHLASALTGAVEMTEVLYEITNRATQVTRADGVYVERVVSDGRAVEIVASAGRGTPARGLRVTFPGSMTDEVLNRREPVILTNIDDFGKAMVPYLRDACPNCQVLITPLVDEEETLGALVLLNSRQSGRTFSDGDIVRARTLGDLTSLALRRVRLMEQERQAKEKAEAAVRVRDETLGIVSHDLRNPLTKILLSAEMINAAGQDQQRDLIATIQSSAAQMDRLIQDLLDVARLEAGRFSVEKKTIGTAPIVKSACQSSQPLAEKNRQEIICDAPDDLPAICADPGRLLQVFGNLIGNAMKFTPAGGTVTVMARPAGSEVEFRVADTGPGLPDADMKNLFRPYWQAKKTAHMGAGLGLAIVRGIVEAHGGKVHAANAPGGGAVFMFTIPRA